MGETTVLIQNAFDGDEKSLQDLVLRVHNNLVAIARSCVREPTTFDAGDLVHEAFIKLHSRIQSDGARMPRNSSEFYGYVTQLMRHFMTDAYRRQNRMVNWESVAAKTGEEVGTRPPEILSNIGELVEKFERLYKSHGEVLHLRVYAGMTNQEVAEVLRRTPGSTRNSYAFAVAWLRAELHDTLPGS